MDGWSDENVYSMVNDHMGEDASESLRKQVTQNQTPAVVEEVDLVNKALNEQSDA